jgi:enolase-phosphatase E1
VTSLQVGGIVLDIEGTTSSVAFVFDVLFPYARTRLEAFLHERWDGAEVVHARHQMARDAGAASFTEWCAASTPSEQQRFVQVEALRLMDRDAKTTGLKELQGLIWRDGYASGMLRSHVYDDVPPALARWQARGLDVRIYSSGSVTAQRQFFAHTIEGDLCGFLCGHYDTTTGPKRDAASYQRIAADMQQPAARLAFFSDVVEELDAARSAGWQTLLVVRPGNAAVRAGHGHPVISDFNGIG